MDEKKTLGEYVNEVKAALEEVYPNSFFFSGASDMAVIRNWYKLGIPPHFVLLALNNDSLPNRFSLFDIDEVVRKKYRSFTKTEAKEASVLIASETIPYRKLEKLYTILKSILLELDIDDFSCIDPILELKNLNDKTMIERKLEDLEKKFFSILLENSPFASECLKQAEKRLSRFRFYWKKDIALVTKKALVKNCLKEKHGVPDFSLI